MKINLSKILSFLILTTVIGMNTACAQTLSKEQKKDSINSLKNYHSTTNGYLLKNSPKHKPKIPAFQCLSNSSESCEFQEIVHNNKYTPSSPSFAFDGRYKVDVGFNDDFGLPDMSRGEDDFRGVSKSESDDIKSRAYEHFLGLDYENFKPEFLTSGYGSLIISVYIEDPKLLEVFLEDNRVVGIWHIGNNEFLIEEH